MAKDNRTFRAIAALDPVELPNDCEQVEFSDFAIRVCPNRAQPILAPNGDGGFVDVDWEYPEKPDLRFPVSGHYLEMEFDASVGYGWREAEWLLAWHLTKLRLFKEGMLWGSLYRVEDMARPGVMAGTNDIMESLRRRHKEPPPGPFFGLWLKPYKIAESDIKEIRNFVDRLGIRQAKAFETAIRRFHLAFDRDYPEDQAIDFFIALESLLSDDREAIGYKVALRAAHLIGSTPEERQNISDFLKRGYRERSNIVHGEKKGVKWLSEGHASGRTNLGELREVVRAILRVLLEQACQGRVLKPEKLDARLFFR